MITGLARDNRRPRLYPFLSWPVVECIVPAARYSQLFDLLSGFETSGRDARSS